MALACRDIAHKTHSVVCAEGPEVPLLSELLFQLNATKARTSHKYCCNRICFLPCQSKSSILVTSLRSPPGSRPHTPSALAVYSADLGTVHTVTCEADSHFFAGRLQPVYSSYLTSVRTQPRFSMLERLTLTLSPVSTGLSNRY